MAEQKNKPAAQVSADPWSSGRKRFSWQQFRRGRDKKWHFSGQQPDEEVRLVLRRHWWFLVVPALPFLGSVLLLFLVFWGWLASPTLGSMWLILFFIALALVLVTGTWVAYQNIVVWWFETYIITNKRIISSSGLLEPKRSEVPLEKVQQIGVDMKHLWAVLLGFGDVHLYLPGSQQIMRDVPHPQKAHEALQGVVEAVSSNKKKDIKPPTPKTAELAEVLGSLAKGKPIPELPDADENLPIPPNQTYRGPRRTFGIFRFRCDVRYFSGEYTVKYIQRSQYVLLRNLAAPLLGLVLTLPVATVPPIAGLLPTSLLSFWFPVIGLVILGLIVWAALIYTNYVDDVYILTNRRVIDIHRKYLLLYETRMETEYRNIKDVRVKVSNLLERFLEVGNVYVETMGNNPDITLRTVDHPFLLQDEILGIKSHKERTDLIKRANEEKKELHTWFATVLTRLEDTMRTKGTPDLRNMDLLSAMAVAQEIGLDVTVSGEAEDVAYLPPGYVLRQSPPPGTMMAHGSKVEVVLSRRPAPANVPD
jgi:uncharacterized membrane protein YdbT with pleckstrin-like domain